MFAGEKNLRAMEKGIDTFSPKYIDPLIDFGFKKIFKESGKKQLLIRPLNAIFGLDIVDLEIRDGEHLGQSRQDRNACFDLYCESADGKRFIVEVQLAKQQHFIERALFYTALPIIRCAPKGRRARKAWDYGFPPVLFLGILDFDFLPLLGDAADPARFIQLCSLRHDGTGRQVSDRMRFAFLEIKRFNKRKEECVRFEDRFLYILKNLAILGGVPDLWDDPYFEQLLEEAEFARMDRQQQEQYRNAQKMRWDYQNTIDCARQDGIAEGLARGLEQGQQAIARRMLAKGMPMEAIVELTELTEDQIRRSTAVNQESAVGSSSS